MTSERVHYFSNGSEGEWWMANWCNRCANDHQMHGPDAEGPGCAITCAMYLGEFRPELLHNDETKDAPPGWWTCIEFTPCRACGEGGGDEDPSAPVHPDQGELFDATTLAPGVPRGVLIDEGLIRETAPL